MELGEWVAKATAAACPNALILVPEAHQAALWDSLRGSKQHGAGIQ